MPYNGSGQFNLIYNWQQDALNGINISSSRMMGQENDIAAGLSLCITKDGQQTPVANLPMGGFRFTNMGNANAQGNAVTVQDVQNGSVVTLTSVAGTDTITANTAPSITAYAKGQEFLLFPAGANTTNAVTLNINGLGAKSVTKNGASALAIGDIPAGGAVPLYYDGTQFQLGSAPAGALIGVQVFTANGTYTPTPGMRSVIFEVQGAGGGGGGAGAPAGGLVSIGSPGSSGSYAKGRFAAASVGASQSVTVGTAGTGGTNANGGNGGSSSVGALITAPGGAGGTVNNSLTPPTLNGNGAFSTPPTGANIYGLRGTSGTVSLAISTAAAAAGNGGSSPFGQGGSGPAINVNGSSGVNYGTGGSGVIVNSGGGAGSGGNGFQGIVLAWEYA
jgi:hypothetical protein